MHFPLIFLLLLLELRAGRQRRSSQYVPFPRRLQRGLELEARGGGCGTMGDNGKGPAILSYNGKQWAQAGRGFGQ